MWNRTTGHSWGQCCYDTYLVHSSWPKYMAWSLEIRSRKVFPWKQVHTVFPHIVAAATTVFPHIVAAATIFFKIHLVRKLFKFLFPLCNDNLNSFLTRWGNYSRRGNYSREETIWGNTVFFFEALVRQLFKGGNY